MLHHNFAFSYNTLSVSAAMMLAILLANPAYVVGHDEDHVAHIRPFSPIEKGERYNILSLDGGGSRGVMEALILKDVMACLTLVEKDELKADMVNFTTKETRAKMREKLDSVRHPMHPGDMFEMVAGTSTGALMAFGLLHGEI